METEMKKFVALSAVSLLAAAPAFAGGMAEPVQQPAPVVVTPPAPAMPDWTGFYGGVNLGYGHTTASGGGVSGHSGALYGAQVGYLQDFGNWVAGGELGYDGTNMKLSGGGKVNHLARLELKAGPKFGRAFTYLALGAGQTKANIGGNSYTKSGYFGGIGMDYKIDHSWSVGGQVLSYRFNNVGGTGTDLKPTTATINVSYHF
ncbi:hypothetical protein U879_10760 [Defluviimonas sp. 20V17]|uniref:Outer membrane protein beta-barrel domain-containing protein n=2 Tax=Allgaiera indica TaxID=765699 RepID=A0AAN4UPH8_9RHOB|nr:hypothetical protein U879_10760 [Defluviimonas sp. 20V17]GHD99809.1 hypothetical protein GCM10008024_08890 [Allgaiera indica]